MRTATFTALGAALVAHSVHSANVPIANGGFEMPLMVPGGYTTTVPPSWVALGSVTMGVWNPTTWDAYPTNQYVGAQVGYINTGKLEKRMPTVIKGPSTWALRWKVGRRPTFTGGLTIKVFAGDILMGQHVDTLATLPPTSTFQERSIEFEVTEGSPAIGMPLLFTLEKTSGTQANFDDFRLESSDPGPACPADMNEDLTVDDGDFSLFVERYNELITRPDGKGDLNFDAYVDDADFQLFIVQYTILACPE